MITFNSLLFSHRLFYWVRVSILFGLSLRFSLYVYYTARGSNNSPLQGSSSDGDCPGPPFLSENSLRWPKVHLVFRVSSFQVLCELH